MTRIGCGYAVMPCPVRAIGCKLRGSCTAGGAARLLGCSAVQPLLEQPLSFQTSFRGHAMLGRRRAAHTSRHLRRSRRRTVIGTCAPLLARQELLQCTILAYGPVEGSSARIQRRSGFGVRLCRGTYRGCSSSTTHFIAPLPPLLLELCMLATQLAPPNMKHLRHLLG